MFRKSFSKIYLIPFIWAVVGVFIIASVLKANENILISGKIWEEGMPFWDTSISVEPGQKFKITLVASNFDKEQSVTDVSLIDELPQYTLYVDDSSFFNLEAGGSWKALADDDTSPFDSAGISPNNGILDPWGFANYKYTVQVDDILPAGTTQLNWAGPVLNFTDASGPQTKPQMETTSITVENLPDISNFLIPNDAVYKLGGSIDIQAQGDSGKIAYVEIGSIRINLTEASGAYTGSYAVQTGDDLNSIIPRLFLVNAESKGAYLDFEQAISIDATAPPAPANVSVSVDEHTLQATLTWDLPADESDVLQYNIYSNSGIDDVDYTSPLSIALKGENTYTTSALTQDTLYKFAIRAQDKAGNIEQNTDIATASTDFTPPNPPSSLIHPSALNNSEVLKFATSTPLLFEWGKSDSDDVAYYRVEIDNDSDFSSIISSYETIGTTTAMSLTTSDISLEDRIYYWRASAIDNFENVSDPQTLNSQGAIDNSFEIDNTNPEITVAQPFSAAHINGNFTISGTAQDANTHIGAGTGIESVQVFLTDLTNSVHWNGSDWAAEAVFLTASTTNEFADWTYEFAAPINNARSYAVGARAVDKAGSETDSSLISLTGNTTKPNISIVSPLTGQYISGNINIAGISSDPGGTDISDVSVKIQRSSDNKYLKNASWAAQEEWNTATSTDSFLNWTYAFNPDQTSPEGTVFTVSAQAKDSVLEHPNKAISVALNLNNDTTAPEIAITSPIAANSPYREATWAAANPIQGTATDTGAGVASVEVAIQDSSGNYWNETDWSSTAVVWLSAQLDDNFATWKYLTASQDYVPSKDDTFTIYARAKDSAIGAPNTSAQESGIAIIYDTTNPIVSNAIVNNDTLGIATLVKNGDSIHLEAVITDAHQADMSVADILADLSQITGNPAAVQPISYDTSTGLATWPLKTVSSTLDGALSASITVVDPAGNSITFADTSIIIADNTAPSIAVPSVPRSVLAGASIQEITWDSSTISDAHLADNPIALEYATSTQWNLISKSEANDGTYIWTLPEIDSQAVVVRISAIDKVQLSTSENSAQFTIDSEAPLVSANALTSPNGAEALKQATVSKIAWDTSDALISDNFGLADNPITLEYSTDGAVWMQIAQSEANDGIYDWTVPIIDFNTVKVRITAADQAGNTSFDESDNNFAIGLPPVIIEARAVGDARIEIEWDKPIAQAGNFANYSATGINPLAAAISSSNNKIINLVAASLSNTGFTAQDFAVLANTVKDFDNFYNEEQTSITVIDKQSPKTNITDSYPNSNQLIVGIRPTLNIAVSEEPNLSSVLKIDQEQVDFIYDSGAKIILSSLLSDLAYGKHTISLDLVDIAGNAEQQKTWDFWIDNFQAIKTQKPILFEFAGNLEDTTDALEQQKISISTYGAGFTIYAHLNDAISDNYGNSIDDINAKESSGNWIGLNSPNRVQLAQSAKLDMPSDVLIQTDYFFDLKAAIPSIMQAAGKYQGKIEFIIAMEY